MSTELETLGLLTLVSLIASIINGAIGAGGIFFLVAFLVSLFPITTAIPLIPLLAAGSLVGRVVLYADDIRWRDTAFFGAGASLGAILGITTFHYLPDQFIGISLGVFLLLITWWPRGTLNLTLPQPYAWVGLVHTFVSSIIGAGSILQAYIMRSTLNRRAIVGTVAACTIAMEAFKVPGYIIIGFNYIDYLPHIAAATVTGLLGTWVGRFIGETIPESWFRLSVNVIITIMALRILVKSIFML